MLVNEASIDDLKAASELVISKVTQK